MIHKKFSLSQKNSAEEFFKTKVLLKFNSPHGFFDSPHGIGKILFPDFYEWLDFIYKLSIKTDYEWYIKTTQKLFRK